jgi:hypothetical protein
LDKLMAASLVMKLHCMALVGGASACFSTRGTQCLFLTPATRTGASGGLGHAADSGSRPHRTRFYFVVVL